MGREVASGATDDRLAVQVLDHGVVDLGVLDADPVVPDARRGGRREWVVQDVPVTADRLVAPGAAARIDRPLYRVPLVNQITSGAGAVVLGVARAAIDEVTETVRSRTGMDGVPMAQQARVQADLGRSAAQVDAALALLLTTVDRLDAAAAQGRPTTEAERGAVRGALSHAGETARTVLTSTYELAGSSALYESSRLGRIIRDGQVAAQHAILSTAHYELAGRTVLGIPSGDPSL